MFRREVFQRIVLVPVSSSNDFSECRSKVEKLGGENASY